MITYSFSKKIETNYNGIVQLFDFYEKNKNLNSENIALCFKNVNWIDANLCAIIWAITYDFNQRQVFSHIKNTLPKSLNVLQRNSFISCLNTNSVQLEQDERKSTIPITYFEPYDADGFVNYIERKFLGHRGIQSLSSNVKESFKRHYLELFANISTHATQEKPVFVCGQYFTTRKELKFTMVDLGVGFLANIKDFLPKEKQNSEEAIKWAIKKGTTSKLNEKGGSGLNEIAKYCLNNNGLLQVISDGCFLQLDGKQPFIKKINKPFKGTIINLSFRL
jgi:hypothetical protein